MILDIINELAADNSRLAKEAILKREINNELLKKVLVLALDPLTQFYIRKIPEYVPAMNINANDLFWGISELSELSNRSKTGNSGVEHLHKILSSLVYDDAEIIKRIIGRDLKCGVSESTVNKIWPGLIPETPYMRCSQFKALKNVNWEEGVYSQVKADGAFVNVNFHEHGVLEMYTRSGNYYDVSNFNAIVDGANARLTPGYQYHGELLVEEDGVILPRQTGNGILNSVLKGGTFGLNQKPVLEVWDMVSIEKVVPKGKDTTTYHNRFIELKEILDGCSTIKVIETEVVYSMAQAMSHYQDCLERGLEGTIIKLRDAIWKDGTSKEQFKVKLEFVVDLEIVGFNAGKGKNEETFGSIECVTSDRLLTVNVSGFDDKTRLEFSNNRDSMIGQIMSVKSNCVMKPRKEGGMYSLFLPRFDEIRTDKTVADSLQSVLDQYESIVKGK